MSARRDTTTLAVASLASGGLAYLVFAMTTRALGAEHAAPVSVLWTYWGLAGAAITFPIQHWVTRDVAAHDGFNGVRAMLPVLAGVVGAAAVATAGGSWLLRDTLFGRDGVTFPLLVAAVTLGSALMGVLRGGLGARRQFRSLGATLLAENGLRCAGVLVLMVLGVTDPGAYGIAIAAGHLAALGWPSALRLPRTGTTGAGALGLLLGTAGGQLLAQLALTGGPVVLALIGGAPVEVTALFVGLAVYRAPYLVALGVVPRLTGRLTTLVVGGRTTALHRFQVLLAGGTVLAAAAAVPFGLWVGPPLLRLVFGDDVVLDRGVSAMLASGSVLAVANLVATVLCVAGARSRTSTAAWLTGVALATPVLLTDLAADARIAAGFLVVEAVAFVVLLLSVRTTTGSPESGP